MARRPIPDTPVLSVVFGILGTLCVLLGTIACVVAGIEGSKNGWPAVLLFVPAAGGLLLVGIVYLGIGQVIQLIARIAQECARAAVAAEQTAAHAIAPPHAKALYFYQFNSEVRGPVSLADLRVMRTMPTPPRMVTGETLVCQQGTDEWKRLAEAMA